MIFTEWVEKHGEEHARKWFGLGDHLVFVVKSAGYVFAVCGNWRASEPLNGFPKQTVPQAKQKLRDAICNLHTSEETIIED